jgi:hypothetical protein
MTSQKKRPINEQRNFKDFSKNGENESKCFFVHLLLAGKKCVHAKLGATFTDLGG